MNFKWVQILFVESFSFIIWSLWSLTLIAFGWMLRGHIEFKTRLIVQVQVKEAMINEKK